MRKTGRGKAYGSGVWGAIAAASTLSAVLGCTVVGGFSPAVIAAVSAVAAGAILAMIADTAIPEAFRDAHLTLGLVTTRSGSWARPCRSRT